MFFVISADEERKKNYPNDLYMSTNDKQETFLFKINMNFVG